MVLLRPGSELQEARRARNLSSTKAGQMERGMASFVRQTIGMYRKGFDSRRMLLQVSHPLCLIQFTVETSRGCAGVTQADRRPSFCGSLEKRLKYDQATVCMW